MNIPEIVIDGKTYKAKKPKIKYWEQAENLAQLLVESENFVLEYCRFIAAGFDGLKAEVVRDGMDLEDLKPTYIEILKWLRSVVDQKLSQIPNAESQESQK